MEKRLYDKSPRDLLEMIDALQQMSLKDNIPDRERDEICASYFTIAENYTKISDDNYSIDAAGIGIKEILEESLVEILSDKQSNPEFAKNLLNQLFEHLKKFIQSRVVYQKSLKRKDESKDDLSDILNQKLVIDIFESISIIDDPNALSTTSVELLDNEWDEYIRKFDKKPLDLQVDVVAPQLLKELDLDSLWVDLPK